MKIVTVIGARPQFVKAAAFSKVIRKNNDIEEIIVHTGQHYDQRMSNIFFKELDIPDPAYNLKVSGGGHGEMTGAMLSGIEEVLMNIKPDALLVYGDTNSTLAGALAASKLHIPVVHVEAGLRSNNRKMPEEVNRVLTDHISSLLFCSSNVSMQNLANEGITEGVYCVGDIMADAHRLANEVVKKKKVNHLPADLAKINDFTLLTIHRAESTDDPVLLSKLIKKVNEANSHPIVFPVHPRTKMKLKEYGLKVDDHVIMIEPVGYIEMTALIASCSRVATDSGGLQKEAYWAGKPCVTLRSETEWIETIEEKCNVLWDETKALDDQWDHLDMSKKRDSTYGDAYTAEKIVDMIEKELLK